MTITDRSDSTAPRTVEEPERVATVIVGAGQTGLATAYFLGRAGVPCVVLDEHARVGRTVQPRGRGMGRTVYGPVQGTAPS